MRKTFPVRVPRLSGRTSIRPLAAAGFGFALVAANAPPSDPASQSITIDGRLPEKAARQLALGFVRGTGVAAGETPAARWTAPICPDVIGLEPIGKRAAEAKIRRVAAAAGIKVSPERCRRNIVVTFTPNGAALAREVAEREPGRVLHLSPRSREAILHGSAPIRWLYTTETRTRHGTGETLPGGAGNSSPQRFGGAGTAMGGEMGSLMHYESSMTSTLTNRVLTSAIVIVDQDEVMGRRLDAVAAYAALVALAEIRNAGAAPEGSILTLFESSAPPRDLTAQDMAFLRALYRLPLDRKAMQHRGQLVGGITGALAAQD